MSELIERSESQIFVRFENMMIVKNWTSDTKRTYRSLLRKFLNEFNGNVQRATTDELTAYIGSMPSRSLMAQMYGVLKNLYTFVLKQPKKFGFIPFPKAENSVPQRIEHDDLINSINQCENLKHRLIMFMLYGTGLRAFELCQLKWSDIHRGKVLILKVKGKGNVVREVPLSESIHNLLIEYCHEYNLRCQNSNDYIFGGKKPYSKRSVANICNRWLDINPHQLRHAYSQWLVDNDTELETVRQLLGHKHLSTVQIYARKKMEEIVTPV